MAGALGASRFEATRVASASSSASVSPPYAQQQPQQPQPPPRGPYAGVGGLTPRAPQGSAVARMVSGFSSGTAPGLPEDAAAEAAQLRRDLAWRQVEHWFSTIGLQNIRSGGALLEFASERPSAEALRIVSESLVMDTERGSIMTPSRWNMLMALAESLAVLPAADVVKNPVRRQALAAAMFDLANSIEREEREQQLQQLLLRVAAAAAGGGAGGAGETGGVGSGAAGGGGSRADAGDAAPLITPRVV